MKNRVINNGAALSSQEWGRLSFADLGKAMARGETTFPQLKQAGVKRGTISNALYASKVYKLVLDDFLQEEEYQALTFIEILAIVRVMSAKARRRLPASAVAARVRKGEYVRDFLSLFEFGVEVAEQKARGVYYDEVRCAYTAYHKRRGLQVTAYFAVKDYAGAGAAEEAARVQRASFETMTYGELMQFKARRKPVTEEEMWIGEDLAPMIAARVQWDPLACVRKGFEAGLLASRTISASEIGRRQEFGGAKRNGKEVACV